VLRFDVQERFYGSKKLFVIPVCARKICHVDYAFGKGNGRAVHGLVDHGHGIVEQICQISGEYADAV
jgi:hypothetical protein